jgi:hypothetical protein
LATIAMQGVATHAVASGRVAVTFLLTPARSAGCHASRRLFALQRIQRSDRQSTANLSSKVEPTTDIFGSLLDPSAAIFAVEKGE